MWVYILYVFGYTCMPKLHIHALICGDLRLMPKTVLHCSSAIIIETDLLSPTSEARITVRLPLLPGI